MHPSFPRPIVTNEQPRFIDIEYFEKNVNFTLVRARMLAEDSGSHTIFDNIVTVINDQVSTTARKCVNIVFLYSAGKVRVATCT